MGYISRVMRFILFTSITLLLTSQPTLVSSQAELKPYASIEKPMAIAWSGTHFIVASAQEGEDQIRLLSIDPKDQKVELFSPTFPGQKEVYMAVSPGIANFPGRHIYANGGDTIYDISPRGDTVRVFSTPSKGAAVTGITFDYFGYWNNNLIATTSEGSVWVIDYTGSAKLIVNLGGGLIPSGVSVGPDEYGPFSGHLVVSIRNQQKLVAISHRTYEVKTLIELPGELPGRILYVPAKSNLFLLQPDEGRVAMIDKEVFYPDSISGLMVLTESLQDGSSSLYVVKSNKTMVTFLKPVSGIKPAVQGKIFVNQEELENAIAGKILEAPTPINPLWVIPIAAAVAVGSFLVLWKYRGF